MAYEKLALRAILMLICVASLVTGARAQYRAGVQGTILDSSGAGVQGATVTLTNKDNGKVLVYTSDAAGVYTFLSLPPGQFSIEVEKAGFKKKILDNVTVSAEQTQSIDVTLDIGEATTSVTVNGDSTPALDTETGQISGTLTTKDIQNLPSFGRDPFQLLRLAPGVFGDAEHGAGGDSQNTPGSQGPGGPQGTKSIFATENQVQINANGQRNTGNSFQVDGVSVNSLDWGGAVVITPNEESVKEVRVTANSYDAQFGRGNGAQVEVVSQSGSNEYHGSLFIKMDRPGLNAFQRDFEQGPTQKVTNRFNQYGGSVGGPIIKNRLFAFFSYETLRNNSTSTNQTWAETPQFLTMAPAGSIASQILSFPGEGTSFTTIIPKQCSDAGFTQGAGCTPIGPGGSQGLDIGSPIKGPLGTQDSTFAQTGTPFGVGGGLDGIPDIAFVQTTNPDLSTNTQYNGRIDFQLTKNDLITFSLYWVPTSTTSFQNNARAANLFHSDRQNESGALLWQHTFAPTLINEARANVSRFYFNEQTTNPQEPFGLPQDVLNNNLGNINGFNFIFGANGPGIFYKTLYTIRDTVTKVFGGQTLKFGFDYSKDQNTDVSAGTGAAIPQYFFSNLFDFLNDAPNQENGAFNPQTGAFTQSRHYIRADTTAVFIQDDWKLKPNFTVNLGLRWEYFGPIHEKFGNLAVAQLGSGADALTDASVRVGGDLYNTSKHNFGPQIGFAWSPKSLPLWNQDFQNKLVIRGGFGIGYSREEQAIALNGRNNTPLVAGDNLFGTNIQYVASSDPHDVNGYPANPNTVIVFDPATNLPASGAPVSLVGYDRNLPTPVSYRYSLGMQYDLGHNWVFSAGYQGSLSRHNTRNQNVNIVNFANLNPQIQNFQRFTNDSNGAYNALLTELQHKFSRTFEIDAQYTYAKAEDNYSGDFSGDFDPGVNPFNRQGQWAPSDFDVKHSFKLYGVWTPRIFHGDNNFLEKVLGNWTVTGILSAHTGFPFTPFYNVQVSGLPNTCSLVFLNSNYCTVRPETFLGGAGTDTSNSGFEPKTTNFPNPSTSYFTAPDLGSGFGQPPTPGVPRNFFRGPRYSDVDFTLGKAFGLPRLPVLGENAKLDLRANFYNLFNQLNFVPFGAQNIGTITVTPANGTTPASQVVSSPNGQFAVGTNALAGRVIEAQVRFSF
jgi:Carboxypeptidase regulatory-like domain/TonB dependent receptor